jgi:UDPglucose--hexose-1-phosphate uridylyltransferase
LLVVEALEGIRAPAPPSQIQLRHVTAVPELDDDQREDLAGIYLDVLRRFDGLFDSPAPYIAAWINDISPEQAADKLRGAVK